MARHNKIGLEYFPVDANMSIDYLEAKYGLIVIGIYIKILGKIYGDKGHYIEWGDREMVLLSSRYNIDKILLEEILEDFFKENIFNRALYSRYSILTSEGIQRRYISACERRRYVPIIKQYSLLNLKSEEFDKFGNIYIIDKDTSLETKKDLVLPDKKIPVKKQKEIIDNKKLITKKHFEDAYKLYPRPGNKSDSEKIFYDTIKNKSDYEDLIKAIQNYKLINKDKDEKYLLGFVKFMKEYEDWIDKNKDIPKTTYKSAKQILKEKEK